MRVYGRNIFQEARCLSSPNPIRGTIRANLAGFPGCHVSTRETATQNGYGRILSFLNFPSNPLRFFRTPLHPRPFLSAPSPRTRLLCGEEWGSARRGYFRRDAAWSSTFWSIVRPQPPSFHPPPSPFNASWSNRWYKSGVGGGASAMRFAIESEPPILARCFAATFYFGFSVG